MTERVTNIEDRLRFRVAMEELVASISTGLIGADHVNVEKQAAHDLGRVATLLGADRAYLLRMYHDVRDARFVEWCAPGIEPLDPDLEKVPREAASWWAERIRSGDAINLRRVESLAAEAPEVARLVGQAHIRSMLLVPLRARRAVGLISLVTVTHERDFDDDAIGLLRVAGESFLSAFERADIDAALDDAKRELEHRNDELERSNEELERFAFAAAHDLKAPLARVEMALGSFTGYDLDLDEDQQALLGIATRGTARMRQLIEDLLRYATVGEALAEPAPVDLTAAAQQAVADLGPKVDELGATIEIGDLPTVTGHRALLGLLLQNLLSNATKFRRPHSKPTVAVLADERPGEWVVRVRDDGIGIPADKREAVFAMFTRLHGEDSYSGSGIGLATAAKVVALHRGRIWADESPGGGTEICFTIPR
jgi:signal transduction histidine kinase